MQPSTILVTLLTLILLSACSSFQTNLPSNDTLLKELAEQDGQTCVRSRDINGFGVLDDDLVSVDARRGEYYLLTTLYRCYSLNLSARLAFIGDFAEFCGGGRDRINTGEETCPVKAIYKFDSREQAFAAFDTIKEKRAELREANGTARQE